MTMAESTVLVVDDEPLLRLTFSVVLKQMGANVRLAANGLEALEVLSRERVDVMLTDKQMPQMDGRALLETLHRLGTPVPSILFVNGIHAEDTAALERLGVVATATKPLHPERLKTLLAQILLELPCPA